MTGSEHKCRQGRIVATLKAYDDCGSGLIGDRLSVPTERGSGS